MEGDLILVNIDPGFDTALQALGELQKETRLETKNRQKAWLSAIQSNVAGDDNIFQFGGVTLQNPTFHFGRTVSAVFRMVMLRAVGIKEDFWPGLGPNTMERNKKALQFNALPVAPKQVPNSFMLLEANEAWFRQRMVNANRETVRRYLKETVRRYYGKYDHLFPHFYISSKVSENQGENVNFRGTMLIFRNSFTEVIIIETTANATMYPSSYLGWESEREFYSDVTVICTRKIISKGKGNDGKYFTRLKERFLEAGQMQAQPMARKRGEVLEQLEKDKKSNKDKESKKDEEPKKDEVSDEDEESNEDEVSDEDEESKKDKPKKGKKSKKTRIPKTDS